MLRAFTWDSVGNRRDKGCKAVIARLVTGRPPHMIILQSPVLSLFILFLVSWASTHFCFCLVPYSTLHPFHTHRGHFWKMLWKPWSPTQRLLSLFMCVPHRNESHNPASLPRWQHMLMLVKFPDGALTQCDFVTGLRDWREAEDWRWEWDIQTAKTKQVGTSKGGGGEILEGVG